MAAIAAYLKLTVGIFYVLSQACIGLGKPPQLVENPQFPCVFSDGNKNVSCGLDLTKVTLTYDISRLLEDLYSNSTGIKNITIVIKNKHGVLKDGFVNTTLDLSHLHIFNKTLQVFDLSLENQNHFEQYYFVKKNQQTFSSLPETLRVLRISVPLERFSLFSMIRNLHSLESLELSNTVHIGSVQMLTFHEKSTMKAICNMTRLTSLNLNKFQIIGMKDYYSILDPFQAFNCSHGSAQGGFKALPLTTLTLQRNDLGRICHGLSQIFPNLTYLSLAENILIDVNNVVFFYEMFSAHPQIRTLDLSTQGKRKLSDRPSDKRQGEFTQNIIRTRTRDFKSELQNCSFIQIITGIMQNPKNVCSLLLECFAPEVKFIPVDIYCAAIQSCVRVALTNATRRDPVEMLCDIADCLFYKITNTPTNHSICYLVKSLLLSNSMQLDRACAFHVKLAVSPQLRHLDMHNLAWDDSSVNGLSLAGPLCIDNRLMESLDFSYNQDWLTSMRLTEIPLQFGPNGLGNLTYANLMNNGLRLEITHNSTTPTKLRYLNVEGNNVSMTSRESLCRKHKSLEYLNAANTQLTLTDATHLFHGCKNLKYLDLSRNNFSQDSSGYNGREGQNLYLSLRDTTDLKLSLRDCNLKYLGRSLTAGLEKAKRIKVKLSGNPWVCGCDPPEARHFILWAQKHWRIIEDFENLTCSGKGGNIRFNDAYRLPHFLFNLFCAGNASVILVFTFAGLFLLCLVVIPIGIGIRFRWRLRYFCFVLFTRKIGSLFSSRKRSGDPDADPDFEFSAYISFSSRDRYWVNEVLTKQLEKTYGFSLFNRLRQQLGGGAIDERIMADMARCRHVIVVASESYEAKEWCRFEMLQARLRATRAAASGPARDRHSQVVVIQLGTLRHISADLANVMDTHDVIAWPEQTEGRKLFWARLVAFMYGPSSGCFDCFCRRKQRSLSVDSGSVDDTARRTTSRFAPYSKMLNSSETQPLLN